MELKKRGTFQQWGSLFLWGWPSPWRCPRRWGGSWRSTRTRTAGSPASSWCSTAVPWDRKWVRQRVLWDSLEFPVVVENLPSRALFASLHPLPQMWQLERKQFLKSCSISAPVAPGMVWYLVSWVEKVWFVLWASLLWFGLVNVAQW